VTRTLLSLFEDERLPNVVSVDVEPEYGYATRIHYRGGSVRLTLGNDVGLNASGACDVAKDKAHAKFFLLSSNVECPAGTSFLLPWWAKQIRPRLILHGANGMRLSSDAPAYAEENLGFPVYVKPVDGSQGSNVFRCDRREEIGFALEIMERDRIRVAVVEEAVELPDYRLVVLDRSVISAYRRDPLSVVGDGSSTIDELLFNLLEKFQEQGRAARISLEDERIQQCLRRQTLGPESVPRSGAKVSLLHLSNLSLGGAAKDVSASAASEWTDLAIEVADLLGLRYCGVDLACADIQDPAANYSVLEVNAAPGLDHYAEVGPAQEAKVRELYARVLNAFPHRA
jgi:D-alanine-D-alanine ligase-like ATP-grasp enzyme